MLRSELTKKISEYIAPSENVSGEVAEGLQLLRLAAAELSRPDAGTKEEDGHSCWNNDAVKQALADRDQQVESQDKLISACLEAMGMEWSDADKLAIRIAQGRKDLDKLVSIVTLAGAAAGLHYDSLEQVPVHALEENIITMRHKLGIHAGGKIEGHIEPDSFIPEEVPGMLAGWVSDAIDLAHAVRGNLAPENRVMAKAAEQIILLAPQGERYGE